VLEYGLSMAEIREEQRMEYARLGNTGLMVSELCLGGMTFGQVADEETSSDRHRYSRYGLLSCSLMVLLMRTS